MSTKSNENRIDFDSHRRRAEEENLTFLLDAGISSELAHRQVGVKPGTVEKRVSRDSKKAAS